MRSREKEKKSWRGGRCGEGFDVLEKEGATTMRRWICVGEVAGRRRKGEL